MISNNLSHEEARNLIPNLEETDHLQLEEIINNGHYTSVLVIKAKNDKYVIKIIANPDEMLKYTGQILKYHYMLKSYGVRVPEFIKIRQSGPKLTEIAPFCGKTIDEIIMNGKDKELTRVINYIFRDIIIPLFNSSNNMNLEIGIDIIPRNMTLKNGSVYYIDFIPAKINGSLEIPEPTNQIVKEMGYWRHYDKKGIMLVFLMQLSRLRPDKRDLFKNTINEELKKINEKEVLDFINNAPSTNIKFDCNTIAKIERMSGEGIDYFYLRDTVCEVCSKTKHDQSKSIIENVFHETHFSSDPPNKESIEKAKKEIIKIIESNCKNYYY